MGQSQHTARKNLIMKKLLLIKNLAYNNQCYNIVYENTLKNSICF
jgi:hypothetical protein